MGTDKPHLSVVEEEDDNLNDDDDIENLVSLIHSWGFTPCLASGQILDSLTTVPASMYAYGRGQSRWSKYRFLKAEGARLGPHFINGQTEAQRSRTTCPEPPTAGQGRAGTCIQVSCPPAPHIRPVQRVCPLEQGATTLSAGPGSPRAGRSSPPGLLHSHCDLLQALVGLSCASS